MPFFRRLCHGASIESFRQHLLTSRRPVSRPPSSPSIPSQQRTHGPPPPAAFGRRPRKPPLPFTRHSVGHLIVDSLASRLGIKLSSQKGGYIGHGEAHIGETLVALTLFKSKSLMNISGPSIAAAYRNRLRDPKSLIVISDSVQHEPARLAVRLGGSANGHNGLKSLISALGGEQNFWRFRAGVGNGGPDMASYVLGRLSSHEKQFWAQEGLDQVLAELERVAKKKNG